jgi:hypothetical protein
MNERFRSGACDACSGRRAVAGGVDSGAAEIVKGSERDPTGDAGSSSSS